MTKPTVQQILSAAASRQPDMTAFLQDLIRIPSVNGRDSEASVARRILQEAVRLGIPSDLFALDPSRPNTLVKWGQGPAGFILVGHMDTVAEGIVSDWEYPPFEGRLVDGKIYGRGSADNKAGIACGLYTLALIKDLGLLNPEKYYVTLAGVVDEESGASSKLGMRHLLNSNLLLGGLGAIYTYASDIICLRHRGLLRLLLHATGKTTHTGLPAWSQGIGGVNAVTGLAAVLLGLESQHFPAPEHPAFTGMGCTLTPGTLFRGGEYESMVPSTADALIDIRLMPGQSTEMLIQAVQEEIDNICVKRPGLSISIEIKNNLPGVALPPDHPLVKAAETWTEAITGQAWPVAGAGPANEGYMLMNAGIPTLCGFGPTGGGYHAPNEWILVDSLSETVAMYTGIILNTLT